MDTYVSSLLWSISWQVTVLYFIVLVAERFFKHPSPLFRYLLWCIIPLRLLVPIPIPYGSDIMYAVGQPAVTVIGSVADMTQQQLTNTLESLPYSLSETGTDDPSSAGFITVFLLICWLGVIIALLINRFIKVLYFRERLKGYRSVQDSQVLALLERLKTDLGIQIPVKILIMHENDGSSPMVTGLFKPRILLPAYLLEEFDEEKLHPILLHELVHVKRGDLWANWLLSMIHILYFFHPVVWIVNAKLLALGEDICDDLSILYLEGSRKNYFNSILMVLEKIADRGRFRNAEACCIERKSSLSKRIIRLTHPSYQYYRPLSRYAFGSVIMIGFLGILVSSGTVTGSVVEHAPNQQSRFVLVAYGSGKIQLRVHAGDTFEIDGEYMTFPDLKNALQQEMLEHQTNRLIVYIDSNVNELTLTSINDMAFRMGYREISVRWMSFDESRSAGSTE